MWQIFGVVWYQGEADCQEGWPVGSHTSAVNYQCTFPSLISSWRAHWHTLTEGATNHLFPFGCVLAAITCEYAAASYLLLAAHEP